VFGSWWKRRTGQNNPKQTSSTHMPLPYYYRSGILIPVWNFPGFEGYIQGTRHSEIKLNSLWAKEGEREVCLISRRVQSRFNAALLFLRTDNQFYLRGKIKFNGKIIVDPSVFQYEPELKIMGEGIDKWNNEWEREKSSIHRILA
jgi:hypothetical protein